MVITNLKNPDEKCFVTFYMRGWFTYEKCKVTGQVVRQAEGASKPSTVFYNIEGHWHDEIILKDVVKGTSEVVFKKTPPVENHQW